MARAELAGDLSIPTGAEHLPSGLVSLALRAAKGEHPRPFDAVRMHYTAYHLDGTTFDSTRARGRPAELPLEHATAGLREGLPLMAVGEVRRFWIPAKLAYEGQAGWPQGTLVFDVELLGIERRPTPATTPSDLARPPAHAERRPSGLASLVLRPGTGQEHPRSFDLVTVHYDGWTADGALFDSTFKRGAPATFPLSRVIAGFTEGLGLMVKGEKRRLWVPPQLAYRGKEGPQGPLTYDMELLEIQKGEPPPEPRAEAEAPPAFVPLRP